MDSLLPTSGLFSIENNGDPSTTIDDTNLHIRISSDLIIPTEAPSVETATHNIDESSLKEKLVKYALKNMWHKAKSIYDEAPNMVRIALTPSGETALHLAVITKSTDFVKELVNFEHMTSQDLEIKNSAGNTAFCLAAIAGHGDYCETMIAKNENLAAIRRQDGMLPVHVATLIGYPKIVQGLSSENLLEKMDFKDIERLFFLAINCSMYDVACKLVEKYPEPLSIARDGEDNLTALHMLARKSSEEFVTTDKIIYSWLQVPSHQMVGYLAEKIWEEVTEMEYNKIVGLITEPSVALFDAVESGNVNFVKWLLSMNRELLTIMDPKTGQNLLHFVVSYRERDIFSFIYTLESANLLVRAVDKDRNNVLHFAAKQLKASSGLRPNIQMKRELVWFKEVEKRVPLELKYMRNKEGKTPYDAFNENHKELSKEVKEAAKGIANSGMVVAALIATLAFAAALTTPGDKNNGWFIVFILTNAIALFTSSASIISFLSIFTSSRVTASDFIVSLHPSLIFGLTLLFIAIATMVIAFAATCFLIFDHKHKWVSYVVALLGLFPVIMFLVLQSSLFDSLLDYISSKCDHIKILRMLVGETARPPSEREREARSLLIHLINK